MNIRFFTTTAASLALLAAALPTAALAKGAIAGPEAVGTPGVVVVAQDAGTDKPKVEGWSAVDDFSDEDCQGFADQIEGSIGDALDNLDANDLDGMFANLESAEGMEDLATEMGCAINYPAKSAPGGGKTLSDIVTVMAQDGGGHTGGGSGDSACVQSNNTANEVLDAAGDAFAANDMESGFALLELAEAVEADAAAEGCTIKYT